MSNINSALDTLRRRFDEALTAGDVDRLRECAFDLEMAQLGRRRFSEEALSMVLAVIRDERSLGMPESSSLLTVLAHDATNSALSLSVKA